MSAPARIGLLIPYWSFYEASVAGDLRRDRLALADALADALEPYATVAARELVDDEQSGAAAGERLAAAELEAILVLQSMAVPPAFAQAALDRLVDLPLVICAAHRATRLSPDFSHADITVEGATVGTPQLTNVLTRTGRRFELVTWGPERDDALAAATRAAIAAGRVRRARVLRVGRPIDGYTCVDVDAGRLAHATGVELVPLSPSVVRDAYLGVTDAAAADVEREARSAWTLGPGVEERECLARSARFAAALEQLDDAHGAAGGVMNCHVAEIRFAEEPGITPCWALGRETSRGLPWTCSGDALTIVPMLALKALGAAALYHEIEALDYVTGAALLANTGEHDVAFAAPDEPLALVRNRWFDDADARAGACACFGPPAGPATLAAFTEHPDESSGFRFVVAEGAFTASRHPQTGTPNAIFHFAGDDAVADVWSAWASAGVNHHSAASPGHHGAALAAVARHLGVGCAQVS